MKRTFLLWSIVVISFLLFGCDLPKKEKTNESGSPRAIEKTFTRGGAPVTVTVRLSQDQIDLTDYLTVTIETEYTEGIKVTPPFLSELVYSPLLLVDNPKESNFWSKSKKALVNQWLYKFEPIKSGEFTLESFNIYFRLDKEKTTDASKWPIHSIHTEPFSYRVTAVEVSDEDDIRNIKGLILPKFNYVPLIITSISLLSIAVIFLLFQRYKYVFSKQSIQNLPSIDYYLEALNRLEKLEKRDLISKAEFDKLHTELSDILRTYIENFFGLRPKEQTTEEFIKDISGDRQFTTDQQQILDRFLHLADLVKFATFDPGSKTSQDALNNVRDFIQNTGKSHEI